MTRKRGPKPGTPAPIRRPGPLALDRRGVRAAVLCELAADRVREARLLLKHEQFTGAAYIAGYAVELLLKAIIAVRANAGFWPLEQLVSEYRTHDFDILLKQAGLARQMRAVAGKNPELSSNWQVARIWETNFRYRRLQRQLASDIVSAVTDERDGIAAWLRPWVGP